jgi:hypothetical protein
MKVEREHELVLTASRQLVAQLENNAGRLRMMDELVSLLPTCQNLFLCTHGQYFPNYWQ